jgi:hypothetical protein
VDKGADERKETQFRPYGADHADQDSAASLRSSDSSVARSTGLAGHLKAGFRSSFAICVMDDAVKQSGESDRACPDCANMANVREGVLSGHPDVADENVRRVLNQLLKRATRGIGRVSAAAKRL